MEVRADEKDLGVIFDPSLKCSKHVWVVANKANRIVGLKEDICAWMKICFVCYICTQNR